MTTSPARIAEHRSKLGLLADIPISDEEFERSWRDVCAFESKGQAMRPSVHSLARVWKAIMSAATAQGINVGEQFQMDDLWEVLEADDYPKPLVEALIRKLGTEEDVLVSGWVCPDKDTSIRWVGVTMLEAQEQVSTSVSEFQEAWKNELPEQWRKSATLDALKVRCLVNSVVESY